MNKKMLRGLLTCAIAGLLLGCGNSDQDVVKTATQKAYQGGYDAGYKKAQQDQAAYKKGYMDAVECLGHANTFDQKSACVAKGL